MEQSLDSEVMGDPVAKCGSLKKLEIGGNANLKGEVLDGIVKLVAAVIAISPPNLT